MAKNSHVDVGDIDAITEAINKQKVNIYNKRFFTLNLIFHEKNITGRCSRIGMQETSVGRIDFTIGSIENGWKSSKIT